MNEPKVEERLDQGPASNDTTTVFCFSGEREMRDAYGAVAGVLHQCWAEQRKAEKGVLYPYWLVCQADQRDKIEEILKNNGCRWDHVESHFYSAVKEQSTENFSAGESTNTDKVPPKLPPAQSEHKKWWQFWNHQ